MQGREGACREGECLRWDLGLSEEALLELFDHDLASSLSQDAQVVREARLLRALPVHHPRRVRVQLHLEWQLGLAALLQVPV